MTLKIIKTEAKPSRRVSGWLKRKQQQEAKWERFWLDNSDAYTQEEDFLRIARTKTLLDRHLTPEMQWACDLACGTSPLSSYLLKKNLKVDALDISNKALSYIKEPVNKFQEALPSTKRDDFFYDVVLALDIIAELHPNDYRLFFAEISRLMKREAICLISTPLDPKTHQPDQKFLSLMQTEFTIEERLCSHHLLYQKLKVDFLMNPLEKITQFLYPERGKTHVIAVGLKKKL